MDTPSQNNGYTLLDKSRHAGWEKESEKGLFSLDNPVLNSFFFEIMSCVNSMEQRKLFHAELGKDQIA